MGRGFRFVCVVPLIAACGGTEIGAARHVDGEPRVGDAAPLPILPGSDAGMITAGGESGAPLADAGVRTLTCRMLRPDVLSGSTFSNPDVTGIRFSADAKTAYGIASWDDKKSLWKADLGPDGLVATGEVVTTATMHANGLAFFPWNVSVRETPMLGTILGLSGLPGPTYVQSPYLWFVRASTLDRVSPVCERVPTDPTTAIGDFAFSADGQSNLYLTAPVDAHGNLAATQEQMCAVASLRAVGNSLAVSQLSDISAASYRTDVGDFHHDPSDTNPRLADHLDRVDFSVGRVDWRIPLAMRRLVQLRVGPNEDTFVVGVLQQGDVLDVRKISGAGVTEWAVAPPPVTGSVDSIVADVTPDGGIVVGWNLEPVSDVGGRVALQRFSTDGTSCTVRYLPGTASDVGGVLADGTILVAMDDAISRFAP